MISGVLSNVSSALFSRQSLDGLIEFEHHPPFRRLPNHALNPEEGGGAEAARHRRDASTRNSSRSRGLLRRLELIVAGASHRKGELRAEACGQPDRRSGGATPSPGAVALSLTRMVGIESIDVDNATMTVLAGTPLGQVQAAAHEAGLSFGLDIGARDSCTIGGNLATNAGGVHVLRYGMARDLALGLEVVLAEGVVVSSLNRMTKNNSGLDLKGLFIGAEGATGVITRAVLKLHPRMEATATALCHCPDMAAVLRLLALARSDLASELKTYELMSAAYYRFIVEKAPVADPPWSPTAGAYVLLEAEGADEGTLQGRLQALLARAMEAGCLLDAVLAASHQAARRLWSIREPDGLFARILTHRASFDISFAVSDMASAVARLEALGRDRWPGLTVAVFGHVADGNLHVITGFDDGRGGFDGDVKTAVYEIVAEFDGAISAEHGVGALKLPYIRYSRSEAELSVIRRIRRALDPHGVMNPGKMSPD